MNYRIPIPILGTLLFVLALQSSSGAQSERKSGVPDEQHLIGSLEGPALFRAYCAACHGVDARGGGPAAAALKSPPPDLTLISQRYGGKFPVFRVQRIISGEETSEVAHGSRQMPVWGPVFGQIAWDQDLGNVRIYNLTKYLESLQRK